MSKVKKQHSGYTSLPAADINEAVAVPEKPRPMTMLGLPSHEAETPGILRRIYVEVSEFVETPGTLDFKVTTDVCGHPRIETRKKLSVHHFHGYFDSVWTDMGKQIKAAVG